MYSSLLECLKMMWCCHLTHASSNLGRNETSLAGDTMSKLLVVTSKSAGVVGRGGVELQTLLSCAFTHRDIVSEFITGGTLSASAGRRSGTGVL